MRDRTGESDYGARVDWYRRSTLAAHAQVPKVLALPSPAALAETNARLRDEIIERRKAEQHINELARQLERRVAERTEELANTVKMLEKEVSARKEAEQRLSKSLEEKEILFKEAHHRVKNNLQTVYSLLYLQSQMSDDAEVTELFRDCAERIQTMGMVHQQLSGSTDLTAIALPEYLRDLTAKLSNAYRKQGNNIEISIESNPVVLRVDVAIPCGLIVNELVSNALKHAFPKGEEGKIAVAFRLSNESELSLSVCDNGVGMARSVDSSDRGTHGLQLVKVLVDQLDGSLEYRCAAGTAIEVRFPLLNSAPEARM